jgi:alkylation response protein AidB-like acyl-CoA dehydrogenase
MAVPLPERQWIVHFDDVELGPDALLGAAGDGLAVVFSAGLNPERILIAATAIGLGRLAVTRAADYARERVVWNVPIGAHQAVAHPLAQSWMEIEVARLAAMRAAWLHDRGLPAGEAANLAKFTATEAAVAAADRGLQTHGGNGFTVEYGMIELLLVARTMQTVPVSREMVLNFVAQHALGLPRSY